MYPFFVKKKKCKKKLRQAALIYGSHVYRLWATLVLHVFSNQQMVIYHLASGQLFNNKTKPPTQQTEKAYIH